MRNAVLLKRQIGMGYVKLHGFRGNPSFDSREWGAGLQIQSYLGFYLSKSTTIGVKLKLRHMPFSSGQLCNPLICIFMNINESLKYKVKS